MGRGSVPQDGSRPIRRCARDGASRGRDPRGLRCNGGSRIPYSMFAARWSDSCSDGRLPSPSRRSRDTAASFGLSAAGEGALACPSAERAHERRAIPPAGSLRPLWHKSHSSYRARRTSGSEEDRVRRRPACSAARGPEPPLPEGAVPCGTCKHPIGVRGTADTTTLGDVAANIRSLQCRARRQLAVNLRVCSRPTPAATRRVRVVRR
jgi:hypothetical protein